MNLRQIATVAFLFASAPGIWAAIPFDTDLVLQLEATDGVTTGPGGKVTHWTDQSGNGNDLVAGGNPRLGMVTTPLRQPAIQMDGNDLLERVDSTDAITGLPSGSANRTVFLVGRYTAATAMAGFAFGNAANNEAFGLVIDPSTGKPAIQGYGAGNDFVPSAGFNMTAAGWLIQTGRVDGPLADLFLNGSAVGFASFVHSYSTGGGLIRIGREIGNAGYATMDVAAVLVYNRALNDTEREQVEDYLDAKYLAVLHNTVPEVAITGPADRLLVAPGDPVTFNATASDAEDGDLSSSVTWISNLDGVLGTGTGLVLTSLSPGVHTITAEVEDSITAYSEDSVTVVVDPTPPPAAGDLVLRLEAPLGVSESGGTVMQWMDFSGWNNHLEPTGDPDSIAVTTPTGQPAIHFDGDDELERSDAVYPITGLPLGNADRTVFLVASYQAAGAKVGLAYGSGAPNEAFGLVAAGAGGQLALQGYDAGNDLVSAEPGVGEGWLVQSAVLDSGTATLFRDDNEIGQFVHAYNTSGARVRIGREIGSTGYATMDVAAVLIYDRALDAAERTAVNDWLAEKYVAVPAPPVVSITGPADATTVNEGDSVSFTATATDAEDGDVAASLEWTSNLDGTIGTGASFSSATLSVGVHTITATATDSSFATGDDSITLTVNAAVVAATFENWLLAHGYTSVSGFDGDSDGNGVRDGEEYFYNQSTNDGSDTGNMLRMVPNGADLELHFTRLTVADDITAVLEVSTTLGAWSPAQEGVDYEVLSETVNGEETAVVYRVLGDAKKGFFRFTIGQVVSDTFAQWLAANGYTSAGFGADSDGNGIDDGTEYFFNQSPNDPADLGNLPRVVVVGGEKQLHYTRLTAIGDATGTLQCSTLTSPWTTAVEGVDYEVVSETSNGAATDVVLRLIGPNPFWRVEVTLNP